jgi:acetyl esterase/lipase
MDNLAGLPPAWIGTGSLDLFVNEDIEHARRLVDAGVRTDLLVVAGAYHGFDGLVPNASVSKSFTLSWSLRPAPCEDGSDDEAIDDAVDKVRDNGPLVGAEPDGVGDE